MKLIRWWGIAVFAGLLILMTALWILLAPKLIKSSIEELSSEALGAQVSVQDVDLQLFPLSLTLNNIEAANPEKPMENLFESSKVSLAIDSETLLWKKIVVDEIVLTDVKTGTPRTSSGELVGGRKSAQIAERALEIEIPQISKDEVSQIVENADLITVQRVNNLKNTQSKLEKEWQNALDKEKFEARTQAIEAEYNRLRARYKENKLNLIKDRKEWKALKNRIEAERDNIRNLSNKIKQDKALIKDQLQAVKAGPKADLEKVMSNYGLGNGLEGVIDKYLGPKYAPWVKRAIEMTQSVGAAGSSEEQLAKQKGIVAVGQRVFYPDEKTFPDILVKKLKLSGGGQGWDLDGDGFDLGYLPWLTGNPAKINLKLGGERKGNIDFISSWQSATSMSSRLTAKIQSWPIKEMVLFNTKEGDWKINSGDFQADIKGELTLQKVDFSLAVNIASPNIAVPQGLKDWQAEFATSINQQSKISFDILVSGTVTEPRISIKSNLEELLKVAVGNKVKTKIAALKTDFKQSIQAKVGDTKQLEGFSEKLSNWQNQLGNKDDLLKKLLGDIKL